MGRLRVAPTPEAELRDRLGFPGMAVMTWAFGGTATSPHRLANHREHSVVYSSTHDTDTLASAVPDRDPWELVRLTLSSRAVLSILALQDVLGLGSEARMNRPGEIDGNWSWRFDADSLDDTLAEALRRETEAAGRI